MRKKGGLLKTNKQTRELPLTKKQKQRSGHALIVINIGLNNVALQGMCFLDQAKFNELFLSFYMIG